jgi:putative glycerol-1-phosphate prenyltransferase
MRTETVLHKFELARAQRLRQLAILLDPDKCDEADIYRSASLQPNYVFVGGSLLTRHRFDEVMNTVRSVFTVPVVIFPGSITQVHPKADAILFLSLISGRNPELLIGQQVLAAPAVQSAGIEPIPTGYLLIEGGNLTTAAYISNTLPIPAAKPDIAATTALAGQMLGMRMMYLDSGSGAKQTVPPDMIQAVKNTVQTPVIVGGGIRTPQQANDIWNAGADIIVIGTAFEEKNHNLKEISSLRNS